MAVATYRENAHANKVIADGVRDLNVDGRYGNLSPEAKFLYALTLDRVRLSERNGWRDESGRPFIRFSAGEAALLLDVSVSCGRSTNRTAGKRRTLTAERAGAFPQNLTG